MITINTRYLMVSGLVAALGLGVVSLPARAADSQDRSGKIAPCANASQDEIAALVKRDYLQNRITRWQSDKTLFGTQAPVVWVVASSITGSASDWQVPLKVSGNKTQKTYNVRLNCQAGEINYGQPQ